MTSILWRPNIPLSTDGEALSNSVSDLFSSFPYERLPEDATMSFFLKPSTPIILILAYVLSEKYFLPQVCRSLGVKGRSNMWKTIFALHNFALAIFSFVVWVNSWVSSRTAVCMIRFVLFL